MSQICAYARDRIKELIKMYYPVSCGEGNETELPSRPLTCEEQNVLRYVAGNVIRKL